MRDEAGDFATRQVAVATAQAVRPSLDNNLQVGNALVGLDFDEIVPDAAAEPEVWAAVAPFDSFVRCIGLGPQTRKVNYDPTAPLHDRYRMDIDFLPPEDASVACVLVPGADPDPPRDPAQGARGGLDRRL